MKYNVKESTPIKHVVEIEISSEDFDNYFNETLRDVAQTLEIPGFRKGKTPVNMVEQHIGTEKILSEAAEKAVSESWKKYLEESSIEAVSQPDLQILKIAKGNPFVFTASVEILSPLKLPDIKKIAGEIKKEEIKVEEKEIEDALLWLRNARAILTDKAEPIEKGDFIEFTFSFNDLPDTFAHMKGEQRDGFIVGKTHFIEGLKEAVIGIKKGEEKEFQGKIEQKIDKMQPEKMPVKTKIKIESVQKMDLPELTDEWVKTLGRFDTVAALREDIRKGLAEEKRIAELNKTRIEAIDKILEKVKFEIPSILLTREQDNLFENLKDRVNHELNIALPEYLKQIKKTEEEVKTEFEKMALDRVKRFLVLHQISKNEKIISTNEEVAARMEEILKQYPENEKNNIDLERLSYMVADDIVKEKIFAFLGL